MMAACSSAAVDEAVLRSERMQSADSARCIPVDDDDDLFIYLYQQRVIQKDNEKLQLLSRG
jgi:hypothetical protein